MEFRAQEIAQFINGTVIGDSEVIVRGITNSENPLAGHIAFAEKPKFLKDLEASDIACIIVHKSVNSSSKTIIQVDHPKLAWALLLHKFFPPITFKPQISKNAVIAESAKIGKDVTIEAFVVICENAEIADHTIIRSHCFIGENVKIGKHCMLHAGVKIYHRCILGENVILHSGAVIGTDGFGYVTTPQGQIKVPQVGIVELKENVEIGANTTIDRATIGSTIIGSGTKIDNQVQVGHNVVIGQHTVISAHTGISGSCKIGSFVTMGGKAGLGDHVEIGDFTMVGAGSGFATGKKVPGRQIVFGQPARPYAEARKQIAAQLKSAQMLQDIRELKKKVEVLELEKSNSSKN
jgi:UDP-3-O-[3-hydroxymyristoyl] glucosamine N-acyltransferase